jgi:hypothetical protein
MAVEVSMEEWDVSLTVGVKAATRNHEAEGERA